MKDTTLLASVMPNYSSDYDTPEAGYVSLYPKDNFLRYKLDNGDIYDVAAIKGVVNNKFPVWNSTNGWEATQGTFNLTGDTDATATLFESNIVRLTGQAISQKTELLTGTKDDSILIYDDSDTTDPLKKITLDNLYNFINTSSIWIESSSISIELNSSYVRVDFSGATVIDIGSLSVINGIYANGLNVTRLSETIAPLLRVDTDDNATVAELPLIEFSSIISSTPTDTNNIITYQGVGTDSAPKGPTSTNYGWAFDGMIKVEINNNERYIPYYTKEANTTPT